MMSRIQSPKKLNANTTTVIAKPGKRANHHTSRITDRSLPTP